MIICYVLCLLCYFLCFIICCNVESYDEIEFINVFKYLEILVVIFSRLKVNWESCSCFMECDGFMVVNNGICYEKCICYFDDNDVFFVVWKFIYFYI